MTARVDREAPFWAGDDEAIEATLLHRPPEARVGTVELKPQDGDGSCAATLVQVKGAQQVWSQGRGGGSWHLALSCPPSTPIRGT